MNNYPSYIQNWINNSELKSGTENTIKKINPATGEILSTIYSAANAEVDMAITSASDNFSAWSNTPVIKRAEILRQAVLIMQDKKQEIAQIVHLETGKSLKDASGEVDGCIELGFFYAGEGRRFYGKTTTSAMPNRYAMTIREPVGICALIVPFNTPIANVCWKTFPALLCGNTVVLKAASDTPYTPVWFGKILKEAGLPGGVYSVLQGSGNQTGKQLIDDKRINLVSFTGSSSVGKLIAKSVSERLIKVSLELGGKNPFIVCDDADLEEAVNWAVLSSFSNAGQRCAASSRIIVFDKVYEKFKKRFLEQTLSLKLGNQDTDDLGPVINRKQLDNMLIAVKNTKGKILAGGKKPADNRLTNGYYMQPTVIEGASLNDEVVENELFGPIAVLFKVEDTKEALTLANSGTFGLTAAVHTNSYHRAQFFIKNIIAGTVSINGPSYGAEPHLPFGGFKNSGNGHREPGEEALDIYSQWKTVYLKYDPNNI